MLNAEATAPDPRKNNRRPIYDSLLIQQAYLLYSVRLRVWWFDDSLAGPHSSQSSSSSSIVFMDLDVDSFVKAFDWFVDLLSRRSLIVPRELPEVPSMVFLNVFISLRTWSICERTIRISARFAFPLIDMSLTTKS